MKKALLLLFLAFSVTAFALMAFIFVGCTDDPEEVPSTDINTPIHIDPNPDPDPDPDPDPQPQDDGAVDLGLTVLWASCNLGATKPEEFGDYYGWAELVPYYSSLDPLTWKDGKSEGYAWNSNRWFPAYNKVSKYCPRAIDLYWGKEGDPDNLLTIEPEDDAATVERGAPWRIPTGEEWEALKDNCEWEWTTLEGVGGYRVTASNGNSIFLPAAGQFEFKNLEDPGSLGGYWSSTLNDNLPDGAQYFHFYPTYYFTAYCFRYYGNTIRPVRIPAK